MAFREVIYQPSVGDHDLMIRPFRLKLREIQAVVLSR